MRMPKFSYSHTDMVARDWRSLKMKLIGARCACGIVGSYLFLHHGLWLLAAVASNVRQYTHLHVQSFWGNESGITKRRFVFEGVGGVAARAVVGGEVKLWSRSANILG
jgi:hypothetical protein